MNETQLLQVKHHLQKYGCLSSWQAITEYHITRLSQYIHILRRAGLNITDEWQQNETSRWKLYKLERN